MLHRPNPAEIVHSITTHYCFTGAVEERILRAKDRTTRSPRIKPVGLDSVISCVRTKRIGRAPARHQNKPLHSTRTNRAAMKGCAMGCSEGPQINPSRSQTNPMSSAGFVSRPTIKGSWSDDAKRLGSKKAGLLNSES